MKKENVLSAVRWPAITRLRELSNLPAGVPPPVRRASGGLSGHRDRLIRRRDAVRPRKGGGGVAVSITVWCDDELHPADRGTAGPDGRRWIFVAEFFRPNILWLAAKPQRRGVKWWADERGNNLHPKPGAGEGAHTLHKMTCRYCKRPLIVPAGKLDIALDLIAAARRTDVTLAELSAIFHTPRGLIERATRAG
jgi:hypothetical protein